MKKILGRKIDKLHSSYAETKVTQTGITGNTYNQLHF